MGYHFLLLSHKSFEICIGIKSRRLSGISLFSLYLYPKSSELLAFVSLIFSSDVLIA